MPAPARTDPKSQRDRQMSLKILLIVPFVSQVILAVGITGWLSVQNGHEATQELAPKIGQEVTNTIEAHVRGYFDAPLEILQSYGAMARADYLNFENLNSLNNIFWQQMRQAQSLYFFYAANPQGQFIGVERREGNALILHQSLLPNSSASLQKLIYQLDNAGKILKQIEANIYDPRDRPWYKSAVKSRQAVWSPIYLFVARPILGITASLPIYSESGNLRGVIAIDLTLTQIGEFLRQLKIAKTGQAFILEPSGEIVASSTSEAPYISIDKKQQRIHANKSQNPLLRLVFQNLQKNYPNSAEIPKNLQLQMEWEGATQYVQITRLRNDQGLDWLMIVAVSEQDFRDRININTRNTIVLCALAFILASVTGFYTSKWIAKPVEKLIDASHLLANLSASADLATGQPYKPIQAANVRELSILADSFNQMAQQLQISFTALAQSKEELEIRVEQRTSDLKTSETKYRTLVEAANCIILRRDIAGTIKFINEYGVTFFGFRNQDEMVGKNISGTIIKNTDDTTITDLLNWMGNSTKAPQVSMFQESQNIRNDGEEVWISWANCPVLDGVGRLIEVLSIGIDITERKKIESTLEEFVSLQRATFESIADGVVAVDQLGHINSYNQRFVDMFSLSPEILSINDSDLRLEFLSKMMIDPELETPESVVGKTDYDLIGNPEVANIFRAHDQQIMNSNIPEMHVIQRKLNPDKSGKSIWLDISKLPIIDAEGKTIGVLGVLDDITERKLAEEALHSEQEKSEKLLLNILPKAIADRLKQFHGVIADSFESVTVLFADLVSFTKMSSELSPQELVDLLNLIFSNFDTLCEKYGLEKIKTIGDAYMVAGGIPLPTEGHAEAIACMALDMVDKVDELRKLTGKPLQIRIGIHTGAVIAGVIGTQKFIYDLWGDTVNVASRMESHSEVGKIQVTTSTYELLKDKFELVERGAIEVKGKGLMQTYWLISSQK